MAERGATGIQGGEAVDPREARGSTRRRAVCSGVGAPWEGGHGEGPVLGEAAAVPTRSGKLSLDLVPHSLVTENLYFSVNAISHNNGFTCSLGLLHSPTVYDC